MKRTLSALVLVCLFLLPAAACGEHEGSAVVMKIAEINEYGGILAVYWDTDRASPCSVNLSDDVKIIGENGEKMNESDLNAGMVIEIRWPGMVLYSDPEQIPDVTSVRVIEQDDDFVGLYRTVFQKLWELEPELNQDITCVGLDFSGLTDLSQKELDGLAYLIYCDLGLGLDVEFVDGANIDRKASYWEKGVLLTVELTEQTEDRVVFTAMKWRGEEHAAVLTDCAAVRGENGAWSWEAGF